MLGPSVDLSRGTLVVGEGVHIGGWSEVTGPVVLGDDVHVNRHVVLSSMGGRIEVGASTTVNPFATIYGHGGVFIGSNVSIASKVTIVAANKRYEDATRTIKSQGIDARAIRIEDDVWIGANAVVLAGVTVGRGAVIGAGAVVTHDVAAHTVVAGVPARAIGARQSGVGAP
jgi:acetyltransferase-like isoleucine patch superfamily enzyme